MNGDGWMSESGDVWARWMERPQELRAAVEFTSAATGSMPALVEKDFWCSMALSSLFQHTEPCALVFKGGTLLSKAYVTFNRLSEDLDFTLPTDSSATRSERSRRAKNFTLWVDAVLGGLMNLNDTGWQSFNASSQHESRWIYPSVFGGHGSIKLEISQREAILQGVQTVELATLLRDPLFNEVALPPIPAAALGKTEAYAEKVRAALTRKNPAPRDLFDLDYAVENGVLDWSEENFLELAVRKVAMEKRIDWLSQNRIDHFQKGLETELRPVLQPKTYRNFNFERSIKTLRDIAGLIEQRLPNA